MATASRDQLVDITSLIERVGSVFSLLGSFFIIVTFSCSSAFHKKPINRLVFYASFGNILCNVGTLMAGSFTRFPTSVGCQLQGALLQMFLPADAFWTLAMAVNVWLTFYHKVDAHGLRRMEKWYLLVCYGCPFIPAVVFVFIDSPAQGRVYGDAKLWCWITPNWSAFRFALFYGPVWISILSTLFIYARAGRDIYAKRKNLRNFGSGGSGHEPDLLSMTDPFSTKTTEIVVTSEPAPDYQQTPFRHANHNAIPSWRQRLSLVGTAHTTDVPASQQVVTERPSTYSITISADTSAISKPSTLKLANTKNTTTPSITERDSRSVREERPVSCAISTASTTRSSSMSSTTEQHPAQPRDQQQQQQQPPHQPTSPTAPTFPAIQLHPRQRPQTATTITNNNAAIRQQRSRAAAVVAANKAAWSYSKCAMLFFSAMIITWLPSTLNRLYNLASGGNASPALEYMTAIVLPIQGFWNCVIYCVTSRDAVREFFAWDMRNLALGICGCCCWGAGGRRIKGGAGGGGVTGLEQGQEDEQELQSPYRQRPPSQSGETRHFDQAGGASGRPDSEMMMMMTRKNSVADSTTELRPTL